MSLKMFKEGQNSPLSGIKHIIAIAAGKGGVGKSSVTVNLAHALRKLKFSVGVMDTDIYGPSIRKMLPEDRMPSQQGPTIIPALCNGIRMISMAYFRKEHEASAVRAPIANGIISQFIKNVDWGDLDYLLIDFPPGTGDIQLTLSQQSNLTAAIMVTTPQEISLIDVRKAINLFEQVNVPILGIVENMSYYLPKGSQEPIYLFGKGGGSRLAQEKGVPLLGSIPIDPLISQSGDNGESLFNIDTEEARNCSTAFLNLATQVTSHCEALKNQSETGIGRFELIWREMS